MIKRLFLLLLSLSVPLYLTEIILEREQAEIDKQYGRNDGFTITWGHPVIKNRLGFREREIGPRRPGIERIMVVGDSFTWGAGLDVKERYTNLTEQKLAHTEVLNFGYPSAPTYEEARTANDLYKQIKPDRIVVGFCWNDPQIHGSFHSDEREQFTRLTMPILKTLEYGSNHGMPQLSRLTIDGIMSGAEKAGVFPAWEIATDRTYRRDSYEWVMFMSSLWKIKHLSDLHHLKPPVFLVLNNGEFTDKPTDFAHPDHYLSLYLKWSRQGEEVAKRIGFVTVNCEQEIAAVAKKQTLAINKYDNHPNAVANQIYAEKLARILRQSAPSQILRTVY